MSKTLADKAGPEGSVMGTPASGPVIPPRPLDPVGFRPKSLEEIGDDVGRIRRHAGAMLAQMEELRVNSPPPEADRNVRWAAWRILDAGGDPASYVRYVAERFKAKNKRRPMWQQVIGEKAVNGWLPEYTRGQRESAERATYEATPERRAEYAERMKQEWMP